MAVAAHEPSFDMKTAVRHNRLAGILRMMHGFHWYYTGAIVGMAIAAIARTASLLLIGWFVDDVLVPQQTPVEFQALGTLNLPVMEVMRPDLLNLLPLVVLGFLALALTEGAFSYVSGRWAAYTAEQVVWRLRNYLFDHLQRLTFTYHDRMQTGELIQRTTSDVEAIRRFFVEQGVGFGRVLIMFLVNLVAIMTISLTLAGASIVIIPVLLVVSMYFFRKIANKYEEFQEQEATLSTTLQENLSGVRVVKAFARQGYEEDKFEAENYKRFQRGRELFILNAVYWPMTDALVGIQFVIGFLVASLLVLDGVITVGDFIAYAGMIFVLVEPMRQLGRLVVEMARGLGSYGRVREIIEQVREDLQEDTAPPVEKLHGEVRFENVSFHYDAHTPVLHDISFHCEPGQTIAILGATGSGKTSLVSLLPRFYPYQKGSIKLDGIELSEYPKGFLREHVGIVEQEPFLFSRTIRENITYGVSREVTDDEVYAVARAAAIHDVIMEFSKGYDTLVGERGVTLSGGQKQRLALARTMLKQPSLLILDDATSSVDTETEAAIRMALRDRLNGSTTFIIAHRVTTLMYADTILVMANGRIIQRGTHEELLTQDGIYRETFERQSRVDEVLEEELNDA